MPSILPEVTFEAEQMLVASITSANCFWQCSVGIVTGTVMAAELPAKQSSIPVGGRRVVVVAVVAVVVVVVFVIVVRVGVVDVVVRLQLNSLSSKLWTRSFRLAADL